MALRPTLTILDTFRATQGPTLSPGAAINLANTTITKHRDVEAASEQKLRDALLQTQAANTQAENSFAGQLGLDRNSAAHAAVNLGASVLSGASRAAGDIITAPLDASTVINEAPVPQEATEAFARYQTGTASDADIALLNQRGMLQAESPLAAAVRRSRERAGAPMAEPTEGMTWLQRLQSADVTRKTAAEVDRATDLTHTVDQRDRTRFSQDLAAGGREGLDKLRSAAEKWDDDKVDAATDFIAGATDLILNAGEQILSHPQAVAEYAAEMIPDLVIGSKTKSLLGVRNIGYGIENYRKGIEQFQATHDGQLPPEELRRWMLTNALAASMAEMVGDLSILGAADDVKDAVTKGSSRIAATLREGAQDAVTEAGTEGAQTFLEGQASLNPASAEEIYEGATIGAAVGGAISTASAGAAQAAEAVQESAKNQAHENFKAKVTAAAQETAREKARASGDVSALIDPKQELTYRPDVAAGVLRERAQNEALPEDARTAAREQLDSLVSSLSKDIASKEATLEERSPERISEMKTQFDEVQKQLNELPDSAEEARGELEEMAGLLQEAIATGEQADPGETKVLNTQLDAMRQHLTVAQQHVNYLTGKERPADADLDSLINTAKAPEATPERSTAAGKVLTLAMRDADAITPDKLTELSQSASFTPEESAFLRELADSRTAMTRLTESDVHRAVLHGAEGFKGLREYSQRIQHAMRTSNAQSLQAEINGLRKFLASHERKAAAVPVAQQRIAEIRGDSRLPRSIYLVRNNSNDWTLTRKKPESKLKAGEFMFHSTNAGVAAAQRLQQYTATEVAAIQSLLKQAEAAYNLTFRQKKPAAASSTAPKTRATKTDIKPEITPTSPTASPVSAPTSESRGGSQKRPVGDLLPNARAWNILLPDGRVWMTTSERETASDMLNQGFQVEAAAKDDMLDEELAEKDEFIDFQKNMQAASTADQQEDDKHLTGNLTQEAFKTANLLEYFTQAKNEDGSASTNPLTKVSSFLSTWLGNSGLLRDYLKTKDLTEQQWGYLSLFASKAEAWNARVRENLTGTNTHPSFRYKDYLQFQATDLPENWATAISFAAFSWLAENASDSRYNDAETIAAILGKDDDYSPSVDEWNLLADVGMRSNLVVQDLGKTAAAALNLRPVPGAPANVQTQLELSLGAHALAVLLQEGLVERTEIISPLLVRNPGEKPAPNYFVKARTDEHNRLIRPVADVANASRGTAGVLHKLFSVEPRLVEPSLSPEELTQKTAKGTRQKVPAVLRDILARVGKRKHYIRQDMLRVRQALGREAVRAIAGYQALEGTSVDFVHDRNVKSIHAKNEAIDLELNRLEEFESTLSQSPGGVGSAFHFMGSVWRQQRVGLKQNFVNPQTSKLHRHNISMESWNAEIDPKDGGQLLQNFKLAVAQGLGIKVDKQSIAASLEKLNATLENTVMQDAIKALQRIPALKDGEQLTPAEQRAVFLATNAADENFHSLDALVNWATYQTALANGTTFTTDIMFEVDGVTNGPALAHLQLGVTSEKLAELFGLYSNESGFTGYSHWKSTPDKGDLYEVTMALVDQKIRERGFDKSALGAIEFFTGKLAENGVATSDGRKRLKQPITAMVFGSSTESAIQDMAAAFTELFYAKLEEAANDGNMDMLRATIEHANSFMPANQKIHMPESFEAAMHLYLTDAQANNMANGFHEVVGSSVEQVIEEIFDQFMGVRKELNKAATVAFHLYNTVFNHYREQKIQEKIAAGTLPYTTDKQGVKHALQDLSAQDEAEIRERLKDIEPVVHTPMSRASGDKSAGLYMAKVIRTIAKDGDQPYSAEVKFGQNVPVTSDRHATVKSMKVRGMKSEEIDPGVAVVIMLIHSLDSAISAYSYKETAALNIHDAHGLGVKNMMQGATRLNANTMKLLASYSAPLEIMTALDATTKGVLALAESDPELVPLLKAAQAAAEGKRGEAAKASKADPRQVIREFAESVRQVALQAEANKLDLLAKVDIVDQYAQEGGSYTVSPELKQQIKERLATIEAKLKGAPAPKAQAESAPENRAPAGKPENRKTGETPYGMLGEPRVESDPRLVEMLDKPDGILLVDLAPKLAKFIHENTKSERLREFQFELLTQIAKTADQNLVVRLIKGDTPAPAEALGIENARGWYYLGPDGESINIKGPEFASSGVTTELLLHELTHASVAGFIAENPEHEAVKELQELLDLASLRVESLGLTQYQNAVSDIQEFVAWGMTNPGFQRDVLAQLQMESNAAERVYEEAGNGLRAFIRKLVKILFRGTKKSSDEIAQNGMAIMIANTALLFDQASMYRSSPGRLVLKQEDSDAFRHTTAGTYQALGAMDGARTLDQVYDNHLQETLARVVDTVYGPFGVLKRFAERNAAVTPQDTYLNALASGEMPFASKALARLTLTPQEAFVLESVEVTMREAILSSTIVRQELHKLFKEAQRQLSAKDFHRGAWDRATADEQKHAQEIYDFIFTLQQNVDGTSDFLSRFAAIGMAYQPLHTALQRMEPRRETLNLRGQNLAQQLKALIKWALDHLAYRLTNTYAGQRPDMRLQALAEKLARIEARKKAQAAKAEDSLAAAYENVARSLNEAARRKIEEVAGADVLRNNSSPIIRAGAALVRMAAAGRVDMVMDAIQTTRNKVFQERQGAFAAMLSELRGLKEEDAQYLVLLREAKKTEQYRKKLKDNTIENTQQAFGRTLKRDELEALTRTVLRTDMALLAEEFTLAQLEDMLRDPSLIERAIKDTSAELKGENAAYYHNSAQDLGYYLATHKVASDNLMLNAYNIAQMFGTAKAGTLSMADVLAAIPSIDKLASLYALKYLPQSIKDTAAKVFAEENQREKGFNGVEFVLKLHRNLQEDAKERLFAGDPVHFMKGYTKEIFNPFVEVKMLTVDEGIEAEQAGWLRVGPVARDSADTRPEQLYIYVLKDGGGASRVSGAVAITGKRARGQKIHGGVTSIAHDQVSHFNIGKNVKIAQAKRGAIARMQQSRKDYSPEQITSPKLLPVLDGRGEIVNYRYVMNDNTKEQLLDRDNRVDQVLGVMAGHAFDKQKAEYQNKSVIEALHEQFKAQFTDKPEAFIEFGPDSKDPSLVEAYYLLPDATKQDIKAIWGSNTMMVRADLFDLVIGYRKFSLADMFEKDYLVRTQLEKILTGIVESLAGPKAALRVAQAEDMWQELVKVVKDFWVVKSLETLLGNLKFNIGELMLAGVSLKDIVKGHVEAFVGILAYQKDEKELLQLRQTLEAGYVKSDERALRQRVVELEDSLARNPVKPLIDAGLYHTIAEDIDTSEDEYSFKTRIHRWADKATRNLPAPVKTVGKTLYMTHDTPLYRVLSQATHIGDFLSRYTLYKHAVNRKAAPMTHEEAVEFVDAAFVNYDVATNRTMQYVNDMGIIPFTKYYMRMQRVLFRLYGENPGRVLALSLLNNLFNWIPDVTDPLIWEWLQRNPGSIGALNYPAAIQEAITVKALRSVF